ncbi:MAG: alpha/beta fold hydrolase [Caldilineaceae bacterium]
MITPAWLDRREYPFASHYLAVAAGRMHYVDEGHGSPVVMVHGNPTWSFLYRDLIKRLRPRYRCIAPDQLGFGLSDKPWGWNYLPQLHAANLEALLEDLELRDITLVVQDWGGPIGLAYAVAHPEKIARLVILNTWAWPVNRDPYYLAFSGIVGGPLGRCLIRRFNFFARGIMPMAFGDKRKLTPAAHAQYLYPLADPRDRTGCLVFPKQIVGASPWLHAIWSNIGRLRDKPVQIVWGRQDIAFRAQELRRWEATFPGARALHLDGVGHYVQEEAPAELGVAVAAFLAETAAPPGPT